MLVDMWIDDEVIKNCTKQIAIASWIPSTCMVVLGRSNLAQSECDLKACLRDSVSVLRRRGGGGAVVLHPGAVVVSAGVWVRKYYHNNDYFKRINGSICSLLETFYPRLASLKQAGISDLVFGMRKIAGTSMFRSRNYLLYQASILVDARADLMERYLRHPSREPDYRVGKKHRDFVLGLQEVEPLLTPAKLRKVMGENLASHLRLSLGAELAEPVARQCHHLSKICTEEPAAPPPPFQRHPGRNFPPPGG